MTEVFDRLCGLETEYALRFQPSDPAASAVSKFRLYESVAAAIARRVPVARARHFKEGIFLASGGAVWFEAERLTGGGGLIEGSTPECRSPRELLAYQIAQDRSLAQAALERVGGGTLTLVKNDQDAVGNVYGAQENYEANLATGWRLLAWRIGLVLLIPVAVITWGLDLVFVLATLLYFLVAALIYLPCRLMTGGHEQLSLLLFGPDLTEGRDRCVHLPAWLESVHLAIARLVTTPLAAGLYLLLQLTAFVDTRRALLPFLVSRTILSGAGMVDQNGRFQLADKGPAMDCLVGFGGVIGRRPIFAMGHFFKTVYAESWFSPREYTRLFAARQRLQIGIGDSNLCESAQFLRIGTTMLVLDALDAGFFAYVPRLRSPLGALRTICSDPSLQAPLSLVGEKPLTALELQRFYYSGCRAFLSSRTQVPAEAWEVLHLWKRSLDQLERYAGTSAVPRSLVGVLDWATKKYLLDQAAPDASWAERKKIDLRYHELSPTGYYSLLQAAGLVSRQVEESAIERAQRTPPARTPATMRGHYIREFGGTDGWMSVNWQGVSLGHGWNRRFVRFSQYGQSPRPPSRPRRGQESHRPRSSG